MDIPICNVLKFTATALQKINDKKFPVQSDECLLRRISPLYSQCTRSASDGRLCCLYSREQINFLVACFFFGKFVYSSSKMLFCIDSFHDWGCFIITIDTKSRDRKWSESEYYIIVWFQISYSLLMLVLKDLRHLDL